MNKLALSLAIGTLLPVIAVAATPTAFLENAEVIAAGTQVRAFRVPTKDANGNIKYYNLTINLTVGSDGKFGTTAAATSTLSPTTLSNQFVAGTYTDNKGTNAKTCTVSTSVLNGGRIEVALSCKTPNDFIFSAAWATGIISGHPFELDLKAAGIDKIPGYQNYSWGKTSYPEGGSWWSCFSANDIISARQVGNTLSLTNYKADNIADCGITLIRQ